MEFLADILNIFFVTAIVFVGTLLQSSIGFGLGLISVPLLVLFRPDFIPGPLLFSALILTLLLALRDHSSIHFQGVKWAVPGRIVGAFFGVCILNVIPESGLSLLFGIMVLLAVLISFRGLKLHIRPGNLFTAGAFSGLMGTISAIGGPPMALVYQNQKGPEIRGTLSSIFVFGTIISLFSLAVIGRFGLHEIRLGLELLPGVLLGFLVSRYTSRLLDKGMIRPAVLTASAAAGIMVLLKSLL